MPNEVEQPEKTPGLIASEPFVTANSIVGLLFALGALALAMGWVEWDEAQVMSLKNLVIIAVPIVIGAVGTYLGRSKATSLANPHTAEGQPAILVPKILKQNVK